MADLVIGFVSSTVLCGIGCLLIKRFCELDEMVKDETEYILITKEHYEFMKNNPDVKKIIFEQPQIRPKMSDQAREHQEIEDEPELPSYSESDRLVLIKAERLNAMP
jgi:hypothetical protein